MTEGWAEAVMIADRSTLTDFVWELAYTLSLFAFFPILDIFGASIGATFLKEFGQPLEKALENILNNSGYTGFKFEKKYLIINCWKVLTRSNLNVFSFDCNDVDHKKFERKMEEKIKWGSKPYVKERLTRDEQRAFTPFREGIPEMLKSLFHYGVKIFIVSNSDYTFVTRLFQYYKLDKYIEAIFTPSVCGLPSGRLTYHPDSYSDRRKISKDRVFVCIERYVGRLPLKN